MKFESQNFNLIQLKFTKKCDAKKKRFEVNNQTQNGTFPSNIRTNSYSDNL